MTFDACLAGGQINETGLMPMDYGLVVAIIVFICCLIFDENSVRYQERLVGGYGERLVRGYGERLVRGYGERLVTGYGERLVTGYEIGQRVWGEIGHKVWREIRQRVAMISERGVVYRTKRMGPITEP